jgi:hypothetical protein
VIGYVYIVEYSIVSRDMGHGIQMRARMPPHHEYVTAKADSFFMQGDVSMFLQKRVSEWRLIGMVGHARKNGLTQIKDLPFIQQCTQIICEHNDSSDTSIILLKYYWQ